MNEIAEGEQSLRTAMLLIMALLLFTIVVGILLSSYLMGGAVI